MTSLELEKYTVDLNWSLEEALRKIELNSHRSVIVVDSHNRAVGTLSDGDIRKAILNRRLLSTPVSEIMNLNFIWLAPSDAGKVQEIFKNHQIFVIPILGESNKLLDIIVAY